MTPRSHRRPKLSSHQYLGSQPRPFGRRALLKWFALAGGSALTVRRFSPEWVSASRLGQTTPSGLPSSITSLMQKPRYADATWNLLVTDLMTGETLEELAADDLAFTGSVRKQFSVGLALDELGAGHRFTTPIYRQGKVDAQGILHGALVFVAAGDLTFGGRQNADGSIAFTDFDHNDANNLGTAILTRQDPMYGFDTVAQQVAASGIRAVDGELIVDDRLFDSFRVPNQNLLISPIMVNENMVDLTLTPTQPGQAATLDWRPQSQAFSVEGTVLTGPVNSPETVELSGGSRVECIGSAGCTGSVDGSLPVGYRAALSQSPTFVQTFRIEDPAAFARTAFLEALTRAGVNINARPVAKNPIGMLSAPDCYTSDLRVAEFPSPSFSECAKLILKVSLNLGANLSLMLFGLARGQRTIKGALAAERRALVNELGIDGGSFDFPTNGSGSPDSRATARAVVQMLSGMSAKEVASSYRAALPVLGADGSLAYTGLDLPARGHVFAKTGTTVENGVLVAQNLAGYIDAKSGRQLAFALFVNNAGPLESISDVSEVFEDEAAIASALYELH